MKLHLFDNKILDMCPYVYGWFLNQGVNFCVCWLDCGWIMF